MKHFTRTFFIRTALAACALAALVMFLPHAARASTNISSTTAQHFAWNDEIGWIDFNPNGTGAGNVNVTSAQLQGYASSSVGPIALDCAHSPSPSCGISYGVVNNGAGYLSGWAWNDEIGWISFYWGNTSADPSASSTSLCTVGYSGYCGVQIDPTTGIFSGWAWNDVVGWISFNCSNVSCTHNFYVGTTWTSTGQSGTLDSQTFDTGVAGGAQLNSITWKGDTSSGTFAGSVSFQIATSSSAGGPWNFVGYDGTSATTYSCSGITGCTIPLGNYTSFIARYFRYRVILTTDVTQTFSPVVNSVIVNWSP